MGNSACCSNNDASTQEEQKEITMPKEAAPGTASLPPISASPEIAPPPAAAKEAERKVPAADTRADEFAVTVDKSEGQKLGIDVDHQDGATLLIECINEGLIADWNEKAKDDLKIQIGHRITEVNGKRSNVLDLVDECKQNQVLKLMVRRAPAP
eukprot:TRINITY_DN67187_c0_g1_i1.p1 TRINITY_DN67187_c0_g1~~TRINITY_DN67187_c0_g1_i1.p1  ORF type:complete len:180 (-),score=53.14 TRINITY_DN67187_c0_g1_i1:53-514(-)